MENTTLLRYDNNDDDDGDNNNNYNDNDNNDNNNIQIYIKLISKAQCHFTIFVIKNSKLKPHIYLKLHYSNS